MSTAKMVVGGWQGEGELFRLIRVYTRVEGARGGGMGGGFGCNVYKTAASAIYTERPRDFPKVLYTDSSSSTPSPITFLRI